MSTYNNQENLYRSRPALLLFVFLVCTAIKQVMSSSDFSAFSFKNFKTIPGYSLLGNVTETHAFADYLTCAYACVERPRCFSFNFGGTYINAMFTCELSNSLEAWDPQKFQSRRGFDYFEAVMVSFLLSCAEAQLVYCRSVQLDWDNKSTKSL